MSLASTWGCSSATRSARANEPLGGEACSSDEESFRSCTGQVRVSRMRGESLWHILRRRQRQAGIESITPHSYRRAYVTDLLDAGVDVLTVQRLAGHADAVTTARYDRRRDEVQRSASARLFLPVG